MHWHHSNSRYATYTQLVPLLFPNLKTAEETRRNGARDLTISLKYLENTLATRTYVAGTPHPTIADLLIVTEVCGEV